MKKWLRFFFLSFFSDKISKEGAKRGYTNFLIGLILALSFLWMGYVGGDFLPLGAHCKNSPDFTESVHLVFANTDINKRIEGEIKDGSLLAKKHSGEYTNTLLLNTFENESDRENYSSDGFNVVVDLRPSDTLAEFEAYFVSNDGQNLKITYEEYLSLSTVARLNFDFKLRYTGRSLELTDESVEGYRSYLVGLGDESKALLGELDGELSSNKITKSEYQRAIYELYFVSYYPEITAYESSSKVPLLRNYYYHNYISRGANDYIFIFDDYLTASFETKDGIKLSFYGFYSNMEDSVLVANGASEEEAIRSIDEFINNSISSILPLTAYAYAVNLFSLIPFIALIPLVVTLLAYSILKLRGIDSVKSFGSIFKILASYVWFSALISAVVTVIVAFFVQPNIITALPPVIFFVALAVRSIVFAVREAKLYIKKSQEETVLTEA